MCPRHVVYLGGGEFNIWKVLQHSKWDTKRRLGSKIFGHNLIRLSNIEAGSNLSAGPSFEGGPPEVTLRRYYGTHLEEQSSVNSIWEITHFCRIFQGSPIKTDFSDRVLLRHFNSGKILAINQNNLPYLQEFNENSYNEVASAAAIFKKANNERQGMMPPKLDENDSVVSPRKGQTKIQNQKEFMVVSPVREVEEVKGFVGAEVGGTPSSSSDIDSPKKKKLRHDFSQDDNEESDDQVFGFRMGGNDDEGEEDPSKDSSDSLPINPPIKIMAPHQLVSINGHSTNITKPGPFEQKNVIVDKYSYNGDQTNSFQQNDSSIKVQKEEVEIPNINELKPTPSSTIPTNYISKNKPENLVVNESTKINKPNYSFASHSENTPLHIELDQSEQASPTFLNKVEHTKQKSKLQDNSKLKSDLQDNSKPELKLLVSMNNTNEAKAAMLPDPKRKVKIPDNFKAKMDSKVPTASPGNLRPPIIMRNDRSLCLLRQYLPQPISRSAHGRTFATFS